jgi:hypothetical protein
MFEVFEYGTNKQAKKNSHQALRTGILRNRHQSNQAMVQPPKKAHIKPD